MGKTDPTVAEHPWLKGAADYCIQAIASLDEEPHAYVLLFAVRFLDGIAVADAKAARLLEGLGRFIPDDGIVSVQGGLEDEVLRPLDFAPDPESPARRLFAPEAIERDLDGLSGEQQPDGGWPYDAATFSPASAIEWRGHVTVRAISVLQRNSRG